MYINKKKFIGFTALLLIIGTITTSVFNFAKYNQNDIAHQVVSIVSVLGGSSEASSDTEAESEDNLMVFELDYER